MDCQGGIVGIGTDPLEDVARLMLTRSRACVARLNDSSQTTLIPESFKRACDQCGRAFSTAIVVSLRPFLVQELHHPYAPNVEWGEASLGLGEAASTRTTEHLVEYSC
jgi:hypothetical protein